MTEVLEGSGILVICEEPDMTCELCGAVEETRPYGPGGKRICWGCGEKHSTIRDHNLNVFLTGKGKIQ